MEVSPFESSNITQMQILLAQTVFNYDKCPNDNPANFPQTYLFLSIKIILSWGKNIRIDAVISVVVLPLPSAAAEHEVLVQDAPVCVPRYAILQLHFL